MHKANCKAKVELTAALKEHENTPAGILDRFFLPEGISRYELDQRLEKWVKFHHPTLLAACLHGLRVPEDLDNTRKMVLYMKLSAREDHGGSAGKYFRVVEAYPVKVDEAMKKPSPWPESLTQLRAMQDESERLKRGHQTAVMVECPPLAVQTVPFGSMKSMKALVIMPQWKEVLTRDIENGKKFTRFGDPY